jgi:hypothetical protein
VSPSAGLLKVPALVVTCAEANVKLANAVKSNNFFIIKIFG